MQTDRRNMIKCLAVAAGAVASGSTPAEARERRTPREDAVGMLYDSTLCIGCKACVVACKTEGGLPASGTYGDGIYDAPESLNESTRNIIQLYREGDRYAFVKKQCMHCVDPGCVSACMLGALSKGKYGAVSWDGDKCVGCRYCQVACPFNVPQYEWTSANPKIVKCDLCKDRLAKGDKPACVAACPRGAVISGKYADLLHDAHRRLEREPKRYVQKVYGERDLGGTQVLYLAAVPFSSLGFKYEGEEPVPQVQQSVQEGVYRGFVGPMTLYGILATVLFRHRRMSESGEEE